MSRAGKQPIPLPDGVKATREGDAMLIKGKKGELRLSLVPEVKVEEKEDALHLVPADESRHARAMWGTQRANLANMVKGVSEGFVCDLELHGVGMRAQMKGKALHLSLGLSHEVVYPLPEGIEIATPSATAIKISGIDRQKVGQTAAEIRAFRPPEPYKGKGVRRAGEYVFRKEGKKK